MAITLSATYKVACHTDNVGKGSTFVAIHGKKQNGAAFIKDAVLKGATTIVVEQSTMIPDELRAWLSEQRISLIYVQNSRKALAELSAQAYGYPAQKLKLIGITGTKGKTTSCFLTEHILRSAGFKTALLTSEHNSILNTIFDATLTTPQPDYLHMFFNTCVKQGVEYVVMEIAAQAVTLHRVEGLFFDALAFTNCSLEHLEFYASMQEYFQAKANLFKQCKADGKIWIHADSSWTEELKKQYPHALLYSTTNKHVDAYIPFEESAHHLTLHYHGSHIVPLLGTFNGFNCATACVLTQAIVPEGIAYLSQFNQVPGRLEKVELSNGAYAYIDQAHNPASFEAVLSALRARTTHLIVVFGAGGDRDPHRRPIMGSIAAQYADTVVITTDNPRSEDPYTIAQEIYAGIGTDKKNNTLIELDRGSAIAYAYAQSKKNSIIAILGKGTDVYQEIHGTLYPCNDRALLKRLC